MSVFFNGRLLVTPTVATRIDDSAMANKNLSVPMNLALIGRADSGQPKTVIRIGTPAEAQAIFKGGELLKAIEKAFAPSAMTGSPQTIYALRVDPATQGRLVLGQNVAPETGALRATGPADDPNYDVMLASGCVGAEDGYYEGYMIRVTSGNAFGETNLITGFTASSKKATCQYKWKAVPAEGDTYEVVPAALAVQSLDYGTNANRIRVRVQNGTSAGKKITTAFGNNILVKDDVAATYLTLQYTGGQASALMSINAATITVKAGALALETLLYTCDLSVHDTAEKVADFFDSMPDITATVDANFASKSTVGALDYIEDEDIKTDVHGVTANLQAIVDYINSLAEPYLEAIRPLQAGAVPVNRDFTFLAGASATAPAVGDWTGCLNELQTQDVQCVVPLSSNAAIHAAADAHCHFMSTSGGMERRAIVGGALGESEAEVKLRAFNLNSDRLYICWCGVKDYNSQGVLVTYAPYMAAAMLGGMVCGSDPGTSLTNKTLTIRGVERTIRIPTDTDALILAGVIPIATTPKGYKVIQSVSTWLPNTNYNRVEMATGFAVDFVARNVRNSLEDLVGRKGTPSVLAEAISRVESQLKELARPAPMGPEVIVGDSESPAYKNITASLEGDVLRVFFQCSPVVPINYIPVGIAVQPYSGSASA